MMLWRFEFCEMTEAIIGKKKQSTDIGDGDINARKSSSN